MFFTDNVLCSFRLFNLKLKGKRYKQKTLLKSYKTEIKILANPGLAKSGFEQPGPANFVYNQPVLSVHLC